MDRICRKDPQKSAPSRLTPPVLNRLVFTILWIFSFIYIVSSSNVCKAVNSRYKSLASHQHLFLSYAANQDTCNAAFNSCSEGLSRRSPLNVSILLVFR